MTIELGGNIVLDGFDAKDFTELIVVKKIVGQFARKVTDTVGPFTKLVVSLSEIETKHEITTKISCEEDVVGVGKAENLYMALDQSLRAAASKLD